MGSCGYPGMSSEEMLISSAKLQMGSLVASLIAPVMEYRAPL